MIKPKIIIPILIVILIAGMVFIYRNNKGNSGSQTNVEYIHPEVGSIYTSITTTGEVKPQNRLEVMPSISGRIEEILVNEGSKVKKGEVLALMSSTERAALIDAAQSQDEETKQYWEEVYKKTPIISPIDGEVIVRSVEPGQTLTTANAVLVLSDRLIISAQFDETDVGRVRVGQKAIVTLDAYPETLINGVVNHIAYESELVNNVTIYDVDILPETIPGFLRSGMSANVEVVENRKNNILLIPQEALIRDNDKLYVEVKDPNNARIIKKEVTTGIKDGINIEIVAGLSQDDLILLKQTFLSKKKDSGSNPFMPSRGNKR
jgi:macrolide-specific efflux system membrane fusion protein